jgi:hypothetical protein
MCKLAFVANLLGLSLLGLSMLPALAAPVTEWRFSQSAAGNYEEGEKNGGAVRTVRPVLPRPDGYAALTRTYPAENFRGRRIRLAGRLKTEDVENIEIVVSAVSGATADIARLALGEGRSPGTVDWRGYDMVVDIPDGAHRLVVGVQTSGKGTVWVRDFSLEVVDRSVPVTARASRWNMPQSRPENTSFDQ